MSQSPPEATADNIESIQITQRALVAMQALGDTKEQLFDELVRQVASVLGVRYVFVSEIVDRKNQKIQTRAFWSDDAHGETVSFDLEGGPCAMTLTEGEYVCDSGVCDRFPEFGLLRELGAEGYIGVRIGDDETAGHLCAVDTKPLADAALCAQMMRLFADRAHQEIRRTHERDLLSTQRGVLEMIAKGDPLGEVLGRLCLDIERQVTGAVCSIMRRNGELLHLAAGPSIPKDLAKEFEEVAVGRGTCGMAVETGEPVIVPDTSTDPRWEDLLAYVEKYGIQACWSYPIRSSDGGVVGTFAISNSLGGEPTRRELRILETAANLASIAMERDRAEQCRAMIVNELDHRVKNNLAAVLSLSEMTLVSADSLERFGETFTGRLLAMARTHEALAGHDWEAVDVGSMLRAVVEPYTDVEKSRITLDGPAATLPGHIATPLGLAVHELATNAGKHGSLSVPGGTVRIGWSAPEANVLEFEWREQGGPAIDGPCEPGVGLNLISGLIRHEIGGTVAFESDSAGMVCAMRIVGAAVVAKRESNGQEEVASARRALVVEDNYLVSESISRMLRGVGFEVVGPAGSLAEAHELVDSERIDLAILDLNIDGESSVALARDLRTRGHRVVFVSGYSNEKLLPEDLRSVPRLAKPITQQALVDAITQVTRTASEVV